MAKIEFDPAIRSISKGLGNFVYSSSRGQSLIRKRPVKAAYVTPGQVRHRAVFGAAARLWGMLPDAVKDSWGKLSAGTDLTEFNIFMAFNMGCIKAGKPMIASQGTGLDAPEISVASENAGEIALSYPAQKPPLCLSLVLQTVSEKGRIEFAAAGTDLTDSQITLSGLASGTEVTVYAVFSDKPMAHAGKISESQSVMVKVK